LPREPCQKGTSVLPVVAGLKAHPDREKLVPKHLWKYFDDHLVVSGWYPERDYFALLEALVRTMDPKKGDVWRFFAKYSVKQDIAGGGGAEAGRADAKGVYRNFAASAAGNPEHLFRRAVKLWSQYHDSGKMLVQGGRVKTNSVVLRLVGFNIPLDGFVRLQGYYLEEYGRLIGVDVECKVARNTARGDPFCEWECILARTPVTETYVASLPPVPSSP